MADDEVDKTKERSFAEHALARLVIAEQILAHPFVAVRKLFEEKGAVAAVLRLLDVSHGGYGQAGFTLLAENDLLDYSLEQSVLDFADSGLFPNAIVRSARVRLSVTRQRLKRLRNETSQNNTSLPSVPGLKSQS